MHEPLASLFAALSLDQKLLDATTLTIVGMGTVLVCLWLIGDIFTVLGRVLGGEPPADDVASASPTTPTPAPTIDAHLTAVIAAAATAALGRRVMVQRITYINSNTVSGWAEAGRTSIHQSHNLRRN